VSAPAAPPAAAASADRLKTALDGGDSDDLAILEGYLGHSFSDRQLLATALTHKSYLNERSAEERAGRSHNERLEHLGDAVLQLLVTHLLIEACPDASEGYLSLVRSQLVSEPSLCELAKALELGRWLRLGRGEEQSGGRLKPSLLADAYEAMLGALYLDSGFAVCQAVARRLLGAAIERVAAGSAPDQKSALQDFLQRHRRSRPRYEVVGSSGPDHDKIFEVAVFLDERQLATGAGRSKRAAEQAAAEQALALLASEAAEPSARRPSAPSGSSDD
jgi:ribonuclease-3